MKIPLFICITFIAFINACSVDKSDSTPHSKSQTVTFGLATAPSNLNPLFSTDAISTRINRLLYQRLVHFDDTKKAIPGIASWKKITDTHYRFTLNDKAAKFHHNKLLTSADVKATYDFILDNKNASPHRGSIRIIKSIETPDTSTIDFFLNRADPLFPAYLSIGIVPKDLLLSNYAFNKHPVGSGPFTFSSHRNDGLITLIRQSDQLQFQFVYVPDPTVRILKFIRGELDILQNDIQPELVTYLNNENKFNIQRISGSNFSYIGFNLQDDALKTKNIRLAIAYGIDRQEIIQTIFAQSARPAQAILTADHWAGNANLTPYTYQPEKAKSLLLKAGYSLQNPLKLSFKTSSDPFRLRLATIYQYQLAKIGIELDIRSYDWGTFFGDIKAGRFQLYSLSWVGINTPDIFRYTSHSESTPPNGANRGRYTDKTTDKLIEQAESTTDLIQQSNIYSTLQAHLLKQLPYIPLWYEDHVIILNQRIKNYQVSSQGDYDGLINLRVSNE